MSGQKRAQPAATGASTWRAAVLADAEKSVASATYKVRNCRTCDKLYSPMKAKGADRSRCYLCQRTPEQAERDGANAAMMRRRRHGGNR